jgi:signal transduction histidine kinase
MSGRSPLHRGRIIAGNKPAGGAQFTIRLPIAR